VNVIFELVDFSVDVLRVCDGLWDKYSTTMDEVKNGKGKKKKCKY
jgi:hypothetical protein